MYNFLINKSAEQTKNVLKSFDASGHDIEIGVNLKYNVILTTEQCIKYIFNGVFADRNDRRQVSNLHGMVFNIVVTLKRKQKA